MKKLYSKKWNGYFAALLNGEPYPIIKEKVDPAKRAAALSILSHGMALANTVIYRI